MPSVSFRLLYSLTFVILVICSTELPLLESISQGRPLLLIHSETNLDDLIMLWGSVVIVCFVKIFPTEEILSVYRLQNCVCLLFVAACRPSFWSAISFSSQNCAKYENIQEACSICSADLFSCLKLVNHYSFNP